MPKRLALILGVVLAFIAMIMVKVYLDQQSKIIRKQTQEEVIKRQEKQISVLIAKKEIPKGATIDLEMLETKIVPREYLQPQAVSSPERIIGMIALLPISKGEQITLSKLTSPQQASGSSLAMATPVGKRAISISVDNISSLMGMIRPGDYVDVISLIPIPVQTPDGKQVTQVAVMPLFQNVLVLAVGQELGRLSSSDTRYAKEEQRATSPLITLALLPQEANLIAFVQEQGKIRLTLRSPADSRIEPIQAASWETLFQYLMPQAKEQAASIQEGGVLPQEKLREIEIYRGLKRETITLSK